MGAARWWAVALVCQRIAWAATAAPPPQLILFILADDVGWGDIGFTGARGGVNGTSLTPNLDALAAEGVIVNQHITHFFCTPSRSSLLSGRLPMHVQQGQAFPETPSAGIPRNMTTFPTKLAHAGYRSHVAGKWDVGMATPTHTPEGRGFTTSLIYYEHMLEAWTQNIFPGGTACTLVDPTIVDLWDTGAPARTLNNTGFADHLFYDRVTSIVANLSAPHPDGQDGDTQPTFIYWAPHILHYPHMVPQSWFDAFGWVTDDEPACNATQNYIWPGPGGNTTFSCRRQGTALLAYLDSMVGNVTSLIRSRGLWDNALIIFSTDNGAPLDVSEAAGGNWPLRGSKYANWQGGLRTPTFVSGGYVPSQVVGTVLDQPIHIADWYATLCAVAGLNDTYCTSDPVAEAAGLPAIDSLNVWPVIAGATPTSPRVEVPISPGAIIQWPYKLLVGPNWWAGYSGAVYPNTSSTQADMSPNVWEQCGTGCLYHLVDDPTESNDIAASMPQLVANMSARLTALIPGFFTNNDTGVDACPSGTFLCGCWAAINTWGGYFGPYQY